MRRQPQRLVLASAVRALWPLLLLLLLMLLLMLMLLLLLIMPCPLMRMLLLMVIVMIRLLGRPNGHGIKGGRSAHQIGLDLNDLVHRQG